MTLVRRDMFLVSVHSIQDVFPYLTLFDRFTYYIFKPILNKNLSTVFCVKWSIKTKFIISTTDILLSSRISFNVTLRKYKQTKLFYLKF